VPGLDPTQTAKEDFSSPKAVAERHGLVIKYNYLEPPFPWKVIQFSPGLFNINDIPDPLQFLPGQVIPGGRPIHLR
jgi:hypothetical protein